MVHYHITSVSWLYLNPGPTHLELSDGDTQVRLVEAIRDVPALGPKLPPLLHQSVEETQTKQQLLKVLKYVSQKIGRNTTAAF